MLPTVCIFPCAAILFKYQANMASLTNMFSTNDTKIMFFQILFATNIAQSKDN